MFDSGYALSTASAIVGIAMLPQTSTVNNLLVLVVLTYIGESLVALVVISSIVRLVAKRFYHL